MTTDRAKELFTMACAARAQLAGLMGACPPNATVEVPIQDLIELLEVWLTRRQHQHQDREATH